MFTLYEILYLYDTFNIYIRKSLLWKQYTIIVKNLKFPDILSFQERSVVISTYALCGFANIASIGIMLGALGAMAPNQRSALAQVVVRAMIAGTVACFMTACIAGNYL